MHGHGCVAQDGLGAGRGDDDGRLILATARLVGEAVGDVIELAGTILVVDLEIRDGAGAARTPVDDAGVAVDQALVVQAHEDLAHSPGETRIEREALAVPVTRDAQAAMLLGDAMAVALLPRPGTLQEALAAQGMAIGAFVAQHAFHHHLGGDAGMIAPRHPQRGIAAHAVVADHDVFQGRGEGMAQVQLARHVGRRHRDHKLLPAGVRPRLEVAVLLPPAVDPRLDRARIVGFVHSTPPVCAVSRQPSAVSS